MMIINSQNQVGLNNPMFEKMRTDLDACIRSIFRAMESKDIGKAAISLKINIETVKKDFKDDNSPTGVREAVYPKITYKCTDKLEAKGEVEGDVVRGFNYELVRDDYGNYGIVTTEEASGQLNMFNGYDELPNTGNEDEDEEENEDEDEGDEED